MRVLKQIRKRSSIGRKRKIDAAREVEKSKQQRRKQNKCWEGRRQKKKAWRDLKIRRYEWISRGKSF